MMGDISRYTRELKMHDLMRQAKVSRASLAGSVRILGDNIAWLVASHARLAWYRLTATQEQRALERDRFREAVRRHDH